jgi:hypothetical protein
MLSYCTSNSTLLVTLILVPSPVSGRLLDLDMSVLLGVWGLRDRFRRVYSVGMFATKAEAKASTDAQIVRFTWRAPLEKFSSRRTMVIATRMKPMEKRLISCSFLELGRKR